MDHPTDYHSLCGSVLQSSGYGKTHIALQAGLQDANLVYGCLRPLLSFGFPHRNPSLCELFETHGVSVEFMDMFIIACYVCVFWFC